MIGSLDEFLRVTLDAIRVLQLDLSALEVRFTLLVTNDRSKSGKIRVT